MLGFGRKGSPPAQDPSACHSIITWEKAHIRTGVLSIVDGRAELAGVAAAPVHGISRTSHPDVLRWADACNRALTQAEDMTQGTVGRKMVPDYVVMSVPLEITRSLPVTVSLQRQEPDHPVTFDELRFLLMRGYRKAQDVLGTSGREAGEAGSRRGGGPPAGDGATARGQVEDIIHGVPAQVLLDSQPAVDATGLRGARLEMRLVFTLAPVEWMRALEVVAERLKTELTAVLPQHVAFASPLPEPIALLLLLDEHHTAASLVRHGRPGWLALVECGERELVDAASEAVGLRGRQADALMRAYRSRQLLPEVELQVAQAYWVELRRWMRAIAEEVSAAKEEDTLPARTYFADLTRRIPEPVQALGTPFWEDLLPFERCPDIAEMAPGDIPDVVDLTSQATGATYVPLRALAHYVAQFYAPSRALDRLLVESVRRSQPATTPRKR